MTKCALPYCVDWARVTNHQSTGINDQIYVLYALSLSCKLETQWQKEDSYTELFKGQMYYHSAWFRCKIARGANGG